MEQTLKLDSILPNTEVPIPIKAGTHHEKPKKFNGDDFKRWQQNMPFYLTTLNLVHVLKEECPKALEQLTKETFNVIEAWKHSDFLCRNCILNVASIIEKLPPSWKDFKNYLKHKRKELSIEDLIVRLRIEEDNRKNDKFVGKSFMEAKAHIMEEECSKKRKLPFNNGKRKKPTNNKPDNKKIKGACWVCGKSNHHAKDCWHKNDGKKPERERKAS
ncbi:hypothetical protein CK203_085695 [Vitis vinifera]|uniref:CCHC-type domain-containing protein n=1 Tax=Vitis vinifera TaxID=29760 RepID=A0A438BLL6_VITVI|nr:hypothetical protein CK203_085695 [Vitis vinifera]